MKLVYIYIYIQIELLYVSTNYVAIFRDVKYKGLEHKIIKWNYKNKRNNGLVGLSAGRPVPFLHPFPLAPFNSCSEMGYRDLGKKKSMS
jgi:hypothetical protein